MLWVDLELDFNFWKKNKCASINKEKFQITSCFSKQTFAY